MTNSGLFEPMVAVGLMEKRPHGVVEPIEIAPANVEVAVVVAIKLPTVSCVPVAMSTPDELVVTMELIGRVAREENGTLETVKAPEEFVKPVPSKLLNELPFIT